MTSDPEMTLLDMFAALFGAGRRGGIAHINGGGGCCIVGGLFSFSSNQGGLLLEMLPVVAHLRKESDRASLLWSLERMRQELCEPQPGSRLLIEHLAHFILVQALRLYVAGAEQPGAGWLFALADRQIGAAITAIYESPGSDWSLQALGGRVGMSRSVFAKRFKAIVTPAHS